MLSWYVGSRWPVHSCRYVLCLWIIQRRHWSEMLHKDEFVRVLVYSSGLYLAKHVAKADSGTCGPQTGSSPLHLVFAFWSKALSHSSRPRASLPTENTKIGIKMKLTPFQNIINVIFNENWCLLLPDSSQMAVVMDNVKVRHSAVALLLPRLVFKLLQEHTLSERVNTQSFGWLEQDK